MDERGKPGDITYQREVVRSITIDDILSAVFVNKASVKDLVVKLDVEGAERQALQGATETIERGALLIYEDHGADPKCRITDFILNTLGLDVYFPEKDGKLQRIESSSQLARIKKDAAVGYNLLAARSNSLALNRILEKAQASKAQNA